jgi:hypothetical protein
MSQGNCLEGSLNVLGGGRGLASGLRQAFWDVETSHRECGAIKSNLLRAVVCLPIRVQVVTCYPVRGPFE